MALSYSITRTGTMGDQRSVFGTITYEAGTASAALDEQDAATDLSGAVVEFFAVGV